jgi:transketolase
MEELILAAEIDEKIVLVVGDLGYGVVEPFATRFPGRFYNAGIAEQNMMSLAAGLSSEGFHVFVYSIGIFPTFRCAEQIRNDVDYHALPVTIVVVGGGLAYGNLGYSHHAIQDYALMRVFPNMLIASPGDPYETRACVRYLIKNPQPSYLRLGKVGEQTIHTEVPTIEPGKWLDVIGKSEEGVVYLTTGAAMQLVFNMFKELPSDSGCLIKTLPLWGMKYKNIQKDQFLGYSKLVTVEDHLLDGGFGCLNLFQAIKV